MAKAFEMSEAQAVKWRDWVATRPDLIRQMCDQYPPDRLYRLKSSGHRVTVYSYSEDGTVTVLVMRQWNNPLAFERRVFGIDPIADLEECELPEPAGDREA